MAASGVASPKIWGVAKKFRGEAECLILGE